MADPCIPFKDQEPCIGLRLHRVPVVVVLSLAVAGLVALVTLPSHNPSLDSGEKIAARLVPIAMALAPVTRHPQNQCL